MAEGIGREIFKLPVKDYSNVPGEQKKIIGQTSAIRRFDTGDREDLLRLRDIIKSEKVKKWMDDLNLTHRKIIDWANEWGTNTGGADEEGPLNSYIFAVSGSPETVISDEVGEVQGFVYFYRSPDEEVNFARLREKFPGVLPKPDSSTYEISAAAHQEASSHQIASGIRQACIGVDRNIREQNGGNETQVEPETQIVAYIDPRNIKSKRAFEAAGFKRIGRLKYDAESVTMDYVYILDWQALNKITHERADAELFPSSSISG